MMKRIVLFILSVILIALLIYRFAEKRSEEATRTISMIQAEEGYPVQVGKASLSRFSMSREYNGTIVGGKQSIVVSMISEHISKVLVQEGQYVQKDQVICELSRDNPQASYAKAKLASENIEKEFERVRKLFEEGAVSQQILDGIQLQRDLATEGLKTVEQLLTIRSPFSGRIAELDAEVGKLAMPGEPLTKVISDENVRVKVEIPSSDRDLVKKNAPCRIISGNIECDGKVKSISLSADSKSRAFSVWIGFNERQKNALFSPGLLVEVEIRVLDVEDAIIVDPAAMVRDGENWFVYVVDENIVGRRDVTVGGFIPDAVWIKDGLDAETVVVVSGMNLLHHGAPIRIVGEKSQVNQ